MIVRAITVFLLLLWPTASLAHGSSSHHPIPPWQDASPWPDRIVVTLPETPQSSFAVTWRTDASVTETVAEIALATDDARFDLSAKTISAATEPLSLAMVKYEGKSFPVPANAKLEDAHFHSVVFRGLEADTRYAYRVQGKRGAWSEWFHMRTAAEEGPITFLYVGDAQNGVLSHWSRVVRAAFSTRPDADFFLHAGDLVNRASRDFEWAEWFKAVGFIHGMMPAIPVAGNHEYARLGVGEEQTDRILSVLWRPQFTLPTDETLPADLQEVVYKIPYSKDLDIFVLSTQNSNLKAQAAWLDRALAKSTARWRILSMHHPIFSSGRNRDSADRRKVLLPIIKKYNVDLVLQGHDHTYARGATGQTPERVGVAENVGQVDTMFVNSVSGPKQYTFKDDGWDGYTGDGVELIRKAENTPFFQIIEIDGNTLSYEARTATGQLYDRFEMMKGERGVKAVIQGPQSTMDERLFETTAPYTDANDLK